ncbi:hypothetical protein EJP77_03620 [Paenibacillus zeisoli]|uniref:DUF4825 domain-containing protein n=1 Tax=Paenibacillus zeisoli TaxID=2496267 RepID=A0A3S1E1X8_9BACL|nr:hypothetical protein [Paenibacillus zeisoli]RUT36091.1 hypothetical protein EJP77_03620 [Paenibacillus zeisoli]
MKRWTTILTAFILTLTTALAVAAFTAHGDTWRSIAAYNAFADGKVIDLTENNLVDELSQLPLSVRLSKVNLNQSILSVDLKIGEESYQPSVLYLNMAELIRFSFERTSNVSQLLIRLVAEDKWVGTKHLLLASDVRRGEWPPSALDDLENLGDHPLSDELRQYFRLTVTSLWKNRFE